MRQVNWFFRIELSAILRDHDLVGNNIVNEIRTHGAGVAQIVADPSRSPDCADLKMY